MSKTVLAVKDLHVIDRQGKILVENVSFKIGKGQVLAIVGESGAGKSISVMTTLGLQSEGLSVSGTISWNGGRPLPLAHPRVFRAGRDTVLLTQQPMSAFDPLVRIGKQLVESIKAVFPERPKADIEKEIVTVLQHLGFTDPSTIVNRYPCELSGGMLQRCMIAIVLLLKPTLIIADEPTAALDIFSSNAVIAALKRTQAETGASLIIITHDLNSVLNLADRVCVVYKGQSVETLSRENITSAAHPYTRKLFAAGQLACYVQQSSITEAPTFIEVKDLCKTYSGPGFLFSGKRVPVFKKLNFQIRQGACTALVGLSGAGKSTLSRILLGLEAADRGSITIEGIELHRWRQSNPGAMTIVFQDYTDSTDPNQTVGEIVAEPLVLSAYQGNIAVRIAEMLHRVGLPSDFAQRWPHELSGGQLQRVCIARALISSPKFVLFDEALSSLDASIQAEILELLRELKTDDSTWLFISHDLNVVKALCNNVIIMQKDAELICLDVNELDSSPEPFVQRLVAAFEEKIKKISAKHK